ncbi:MAG: chorismate synthase, partial [Rhodothermia bacterium]|nr:chorismate synthase [Rhodothermia bacterium]
RVACSTLGRILLKELGVQIGSHVIRIGQVGYASPGDYQNTRDRLIRSGSEALSAEADQSDVRMIDPDLSRACVEHISSVKKDGDSLGGAYEIVVTGVPVGLGSYVHWDRRLDGILAQAILSIQGQKAVEVGDGFDAARTPGSRFHDEIAKERGHFQRSSNRAGGIEGGITNGMPVIVRGFMKPIPTLIKPLQTVDIESGESRPTRYERSDVTSVPAASTVAEGSVALAIANAILEKFGGDSLDELRSRLPR